MEGVMAYQMLFLKKAKIVSITERTWRVSLDFR